LPEGVIIGGWEYVIGAYGVTAVVLLAHAVRLISMLRRKGD